MNTSDIQTKIEAIQEIQRQMNDNFGIQMQKLPKSGRKQITTKTNHRLNNRNQRHSQTKRKQD